MRILFWSELFWPHIGGIEVLASRILPALVERGYEFAVVTSQDPLDLPAKDEFKNIPIHRLPFRHAIFAGDLESIVAARRSVAELKRQFAPDLIHIYGYGPSVVAHFQTEQVPAPPLIITIHKLIDADLTGGQDSLLIKGLKKATWTVSISHDILMRVRRTVPEISNCSSCIYNGLDMPDLLPAPLADPPRLLCLGRLVSFKGWDVALCAFAEIIKRFPTARLIIAGSGPERDNLTWQAHGLGLDAFVEFTGWVPPDQVPALINASTMVLMPSRSEGLPVVAIQAGQMARPVISTAVHGLPEVVLHGETGLIVPMDDPAALAAAVTQLLQDRERAEQLGRAARERALRVFGMEQQLDEYDALYRRIADEQTAR